VAPSCPRLPVWEDANDRGLVETEHANGQSLVRVTPTGLEFLKERRPGSYRGLRDGALRPTQDGSFQSGTIQVMFRGLEHTAIASPDPAKLANWYVEKLDFRINHTYDGNYFVRSADGSMLEIIPSEGSRAPQKMKDPGIRHLAISVDQFDEAMGELKKRGVQFLGEPINNQGNRLLFFSDGDGNILHLIRREKPLP
jgi:glyoxylase I family protein